jgi:hypothetical protein
MRYQTWLLLFAGLVSVPQLAFSGGVWSQAAPARDGWQAGAYPMPVQPTGARTAVPRFADQGARLRAAGYRFRPWEGPAPGNGSYQVNPRRQMPVAAYSADRPVWRPTAQVGKPRPASVPVWRPPVPSDVGMTYPAAGGFSAPVPSSGGGYRFRPVDTTKRAQVQNAPRYRPVQVRIPEGYVFRPLNPVARTAPRQTAQSAPGFTPAYSSAAIGNWPGYAYSPWQYQAYRPYPHHFAAPLPRFEQAAAYPDPRWAVYPPYPAAYAPSMRPMPGFRPRSRPEIVRRGAVNRHSYAQRYPRQQRYAPGRAYAWPQGRESFARYRVPNVYGSRSVYQPPVAPARVNRYGMNWYDGQGDGEGAWYRLTLNAEPTVSQSQEYSGVSPFEPAN